MKARPHSPYVHLGSGLTTISSAGPVFFSSHLRLYLLLVIQSPAEASMPCNELAGTDARMSNRTEPCEWPLHL